MPETEYNLNEMDPNSFEHMANALAIKILGSGLTTFGPGSDGGRDGWFHGEASYPTSAEHWSGEWYIQSKYHKPNLSTDHNKWLISQLRGEITSFSAANTKRVWPGNWIVVTNIDYSGTPRRGVFDVIRSILRKERPQLVNRFHIWGGQKVVELLSSNPDVADRYGSFITPGNVLALLKSSIADKDVQISQIIRFLVVTQFADQQYTKLDQAGSSADNRPGIQKLFRDIPFISDNNVTVQLAIQTLAKASSQNHVVEGNIDLKTWQTWQRNPNRARVWFVKGGPGQGKSTITQYFCQVQRAALILGDNGQQVSPTLRIVVEEVKDIATKSDLWTQSPRIPVVFGLKEYAKWISKDSRESIRLIKYLSEQIAEACAQNVLVGTITRAFKHSRWLFVFDGMDEVPGDVKDMIANEITYFVDDFLIDNRVDAQIICTSRPQGYSGQFDSLYAADIRLTPLSPKQALECAKPILEIDRPSDDAARLLSILSDALSSPAIREIMTTPLQSHIMAIVVRDGGTPPERKWDLFANFYKVINKREAEKSADKKLSTLLRASGKLIKTLHNRLGFVLHSRAEISDGAESAIKRADLITIISETVNYFQTSNIDDTVKTLLEATTDRLVLVNTPENSETVRFDIRPLQEFFAAEYIYESAAYETLPDRVRVIASDSHWREVLHFLVSALIENERRSELTQIIQVLAEVDDPTSTQIRPFARSLAIGAQVVTRLLQEGVLEEDQRTRQAFKGCLIPIFATTDIWTELLYVDRVHSQHWLIEVVKEVLCDQSEQEHIGAAAAALYLVNFTTSQAADIREILLNSSMPYRACLFEIVAKQRHSVPSKSITSWGASIVFKTLLDEKWTDIGHSGLEKAYNLLNDSDIRNVVQDSGFSNTVIDIICAMLRTRDISDAKASACKDLKYDFVTVHLILRCKELDADTWTPEIRDELRSAGGFVSSAANFLLMAAEDGAKSGFMKDGATVAVDQLRLLPQEVRGFLDFEAYDSGKYLKGNISDISGTRKLGEYQVVGFSLTNISEGTFDFREFSRKFPDVALGIISLDYFRVNYIKTLELSADKSFGETLLELVRAYPDLTLAIAPSWGHFLAIAPYLEAELRDAFVTAARNGPLVNFDLRGDVAPLALKLPEEAVLLPYVVIPLVQKALKRPGKGKFANRHQLSRNGLMGNVHDLSKNYNCDSENLLRIVNDDRNSLEVKAAAHVMASFVSAELNNIQVSEFSKLVNRYSRELSPWFLSALGLVADSAIESNRADVKEQLSNALSRARSDYASRIMIDPMIEKWREITGAPVQNSETNIWNMGRKLQ